VPRTAVLFYREAPGNVPVLDWLRELRRIDRRGYAKCVARIERLAALGHELRRPEGDYLRDGIHELRARRGRVHYRMLYFFHGRQVAVLASGLSKEARVPDGDIERAARRRAAFESEPGRHTYDTRWSSKTMARKVRSATKILGHLTGKDSGLREMIAEEALNARVARMIYDARTRAGLTQAQLADLIGTKQPVIARLEDADYEGHSLSMLQRIAKALGKRLEVSFVSATGTDG
jgi:ribosome-binding protein aMBF1 (putative translation factor)